MLIFVILFIDYYSYRLKTLLILYLLKSCILAVGKKVFPDIVPLKNPQPKLRAEEKGRKSKVVGRSVSAKTWKLLGRGFAYHFIHCFKDIFHIWF